MPQIHTITATDSHSQGQLILQNGWPYQASFEGWKYVPDYVYITTQSALDSALADMKSSKYLALDTESSSFYTYLNELCLLQYTTETSHGIIDPLCGLDLSALGRLMEDPSIQKIFHAAASDIVELKRDLGWKFENVFDTFLACKYLGHDGCSLSALAERYCGVILEKGEQKSNWKQRPLSQSQLDYAHLDTRYLPKIRDRIMPELKKLNLEDEYYQEIEFQVATLSDDAPQKDANAYARVNGVGKFSAPERGRFKAVFEIREEEAARLNIAPFRLVNNQEMIRMARQKPERTSDLKRFRGNPRFFADRGQDLIKSLASATPIEKSRLPEQIPFDPGTESLFQSLKGWRSKIADKRQLESGMILNNRTLKEIARRRPANLDQLRSLQLMTDWKATNYGPQILNIIQQAEAQQQ